MSRWRYLAKRFLMAIPVLWLGTSMTWAIIFLGPINPATYVLGQTNPQNQAAVKAARERFGLGEPPLEHYTEFMINMVTLDLGQTWLLYPGTPVMSLIFDYAPRTVWLGFWSVLIAVFVGVPLGFYAGLNSNSVSDYATSLTGIVWRAMPNFWLAIMLLALLVKSETITQALFGIPISWDTFLVDINAITGNPQLSYMQGNPLALVTQPRETLAAIKKILPAAVVLGSASMGNEMRIGRTAVLETRSEQYIDTAKAKGVSGRVLVWKHILRNALIPLVPIVTSEAFLLIGGSVLVETVFGINGMGKLFFDAAIQGDLWLVATLMFIFIILIVGINIVQDLLYTLIDPRVGYERE
ncbi:ABC transporter permease [Halobaculum gomorrense]|uniref:Peptide/nickel transport system permease protein n=1 Tax=Halobaculum gomorrense TaxID=43928 RepID=A0A1M5RIY7_9EURY|nr:ABC transporter permease [Halobaculum gomorrense]SHH26255.1 peptide/nickel transport system permease protein [Halobaculum gomorrense]